MQALIGLFARTEERMRTYLQAKAMATSLRESLHAHGAPLSLDQCLEIVARQFGFADWSILAAKIRMADRPAGVARTIDLPSPIPILKVASLDLARPFYIDYLGFGIDWGDESPWPGYTQVSRGEVQLHLAAEDAGGKTAALLFRGVRGLADYHLELAGRRGNFTVSDLRFTPYDSREFEVTDPFGNHLRFWENNPPGVARP